MQSTEKEVCPFAQKTSSLSILAAAPEVRRESSARHKRIPRHSLKSNRWRFSGGYEYGRTDGVFRRFL